MPSQQPDDVIGGSWTVIVPVKNLDQAKSRLASPIGDRDRLALAFAADVVTAALHCREVGEVLVVTDDAEVAAILGDLGARIVPDPGGGLNPAIMAAEHIAGPLCAVLAADLPALRASDLTLVLSAAAGHRRAFVSDAAGTGTTMLTRTGGAPLAPHFGPRSHAAHRASGAADLSPGPSIPGLRRDVDTEVDLWDALRLGVGPHTARLLSDADRSERSRQ